MIEAVLRPGPGQHSVHTPFLIRKGVDIFLFYGRCDRPAGETTEKFPHRYKICYAVSRDGLNFRPDPEPVIRMSPSACRPWVVEWGGEYRMYFARQLPFPDDAAVRFRIYTATSKDLRTWDVLDHPVIDSFDRLEHIASPCVVPMRGKLRMYLTAAKRGRVGDRIFVAESRDGVHFELTKHAIFRPKPGTGYEGSCYTPCVIREDRGWKMLFSGRAEDDRYKTYLASSQDGLKFSDGAIFIDLASDPRFTNSAYKAVQFEGYIYLVGYDRDKRTAIYRMPFPG